MATVILDKVNAHFPIYGAQQRSLRKALFQRATGGSIEREGKNDERISVKALNDISLTLNDGDRVGLIGHNGAGKSTLLKLMAGIYEPVSGSIKIEGRVTPLFDVMPGLDGEDSGYENIVTSGLLIGLTRKQIEAKIPEIEEFCELGEYLTLPVRTYSSGMAMRLGFALATALDPGVLLMDEGIGTGDQRFAERAETRMMDFVGRSRILVLASHSDRMIRKMCNKAIWLDSGRIVAFGPVNEICDEYYESVHAAAVAVEEARQLERAALAKEAGLAEDQVEVEPVPEVVVTKKEKVWNSTQFSLPGSDVDIYIERTGEVECISGSIATSDGLCTSQFPIQSSIHIKLRYRVTKDLAFPIVPNFHFYDEAGQRVFVSMPEELPPSKAGEYSLECVVPPFQLNNGRYSINPAISSFSKATMVHFSVVNAFRFEVIEEPNADPRRHGWELALPGQTRPRLPWFGRQVEETGRQPQLADQLEQADQSLV
jgi:ABC-type polysaccharide/polyol phosphate transport system ATPase subunit